MPTFGSLFAGIGGIDLGLERAGWECRWQVEIDPWCRRVLAKHWPDVPKFGDIREIRGDELERVDLIAGGFPCQPVSVAGRRRAQADERWLWPEFARLVREVRPRYVLVENVPGLLIRGMGDVLGDLAEMGYDAEWFCLRASDVGAPHKRERVFVVAHASRQLPYRRGEAWGRRPEPADGGGRERGNAGRSGETQSWQDVAHASGQGLAVGESIRRNASTERETAERNGRREFEPRLGMFLDGLPSWLAGCRWPAPFGCEQYEWEPPRLVSGKVPYRRQRLQALGNAVVPQLAEVIGRMILQTMHEEG